MLHKFCIKIDVTKQGNLIMIFKEITVNDLQPKRTAANTTNDAVGQSADNRIRKAWSLQMPDEVKAKFAHFPGDVKRQLYKSFDQETNEIWVELLANANKEAEAAGAKEIRVGGFKRLSDEFCKNPDELLIQAAQMFITRFAQRDVK
jgi:hypothetical protein